MKALVFDGTLRLTNVPVPARGRDEVLVRVTRAGICNTDHEITRGYMEGYKGILGHEFIGVVEDADMHTLIGKRVSAEINCSCSKCDYCKNGLGRHCPERTVLGILERSGAFAEYLAVPAQNVVMIPDSIPDTTAVFIEPLAAALEIFEQISLENKSVLLIGDGKLGLLIAHALYMKGSRDFLVVGKHGENLGQLSALGIKTVLAQNFEKKQFDVVIEASGSPAAFPLAVECVKPRGAIVLKSTYADNLSFNPSPIVVNEITLIGSRCGLFSNALRFMETFAPDFSSLISKEFPFDNAIEAFEYSRKPGVLKVLLKM
jgi:2-desacetyl-2-hydroxyethyl bacteriochlorophyllide A dehydrogenase